MSVYVGDRVALGIGRESTRGTGVTPALWVPAEGFDFMQQTNNDDISGAMGKIIGTQETKVIQKFGQGTFDMDVRANAIGYMLLQLMGSVTTTNPTGSVYSHTFSLTHSNTHPTLSLTIDDPNKQERFVRAGLESLELSVTADEVARVTAGFMSEPPSDQTATPDFTTTDYIFAPSTATVKLAASQSGLDGASATTVNSVSLSFTKGADPDFATGSDTPTDIYNTALEISGSFERIFDADTEHDLMFDNTNRALRLDLTDTDVDLGDGNNPSLQVDLYNVNFTQHNRDISLGDIVRQTVEFMGHVEISSDNVMDMTLVNTHSSYAS